MELIKIENVNGVNVVSSRVVAEQLGKRHADVLNKIREVLNEREFSLVDYIDAKGESRPQCYLTKDSFILLCMNYTGYNDFKRAYINEFNRMEAELRVKLPTTYKEALIALVIAEEEKERLELENKELEKTKAYISDKKTATAMNTASRLSKENKKLEIELDKSKEYSTIKRMEIITGLKFDWRILKSAGADLGIEPISVFDSNYGTVKSYHKDVWLEAYALDIDI